MTDLDLDQRIKTFVDQLIVDGAAPGEVLGWLIGVLLKDGFELGLTREVWLNKCAELWAKMETLVGKQN